jgi:hypothetical protein
VSDPRQSLELARRDLGDITGLRGDEAFDRYFLRRLRMKRAAHDARFHSDPPEKCDKDEREVLRRLVAEYDELLGMMDADERACRSTINGPQS